MPSPTSLLRSLVQGAFIGSLLAGCTTLAPAPVDANWDLHRTQIAQLERWSFSGKLALKSPTGADTARLRWTQRGSDLELELSGPVGMKQLRLVSEGAETRMFKDGHWQRLDSAEQALEEQLGWSLPLEYLPWWLRGLPAPQLRAAEMDVVAGRLTKLQQAGWTVEYPDYQAVDSHYLPRTILFRRDQVQGKILLKKWTLGP